jgi:hypothetical protein
MHSQNRIMPWVIRSVAAPVVLLATLAAAQTQPVQPAAQARRAEAVQPVAAAPISDQDLSTTQDELIKLLRQSPTLTTVVARDPSLLSNQDYVAKNNPQLAQFLAVHPEIARNPEFYLFTNVDARGGRRSQALERAVWPEYSAPQRGSDLADIFAPFAAAVAFACFLGALLWLTNQFILNRRWSRIFKLQSEVHGKLIDRFSSNQELAAYMGSESGRRFLEAAPIPIRFEPEQRFPNAVARVVTPLQIGIVLVLLGGGLFMLRHTRPEMEIPMLIFSTVTAMPGLGFIISAGITWFLAGRLGLMPEGPAAIEKVNPPYGSQDRQ